MKTVIVAIGILLSTIGLADEHEHSGGDWSTTQVINQSKITVAFITDIKGMATANGNEVQTSLRLVCTNSDNILGMRFVPAPSSPTDVSSQIYLDGEEFFTNYNWRVESNVVSRNTGRAGRLIQAMKDTQEVEVVFVDEHRTTWIAKYNTAMFAEAVSRHNLYCLNLMTEFVFSDPR